MRAPNYDGNRDLFEQYYTAAADTIGIFWQFHKGRILRGEIPFACRVFITPANKPFDPQEFLDYRRRIGILSPAPIISKYGEAVEETMKASWYQFLSLNGLYRRRASFLDKAGAHPNEESERFRHPYVEQVISETDRLGRVLSVTRFAVEGGVETIVSNGIGTGARITVHARGLFGALFSPLLPVFLSKIDIDSVPAMQDEIGAPTSDNDLAGSPNYPLVDGSKVGVYKPRLTELGMGKALGCPASMLVSEDTQAFLHAIDADPTAKTMLTDFAQMTSDNFHATIDPWYWQLSREEREQILHNEHNRMLSGEAYQQALRENTLHCPYPGERR